MGQRGTGITTFGVAASSALKEIGATLVQLHGMGVTLRANAIKAYRGEDPEPVLVYRVVLDNVHEKWVASSCMDPCRADGARLEVSEIGPVDEASKDDIIADFWRRYRGLLDR